MVKLSLNLLSILASISLVKSAQIYSCTVPNTVALTFDDGPTEYTSELVDTLNKYKVKATFFINAHNYYPYADESAEARAVIKKAYQSGHQIASHTFNHLIESDTSEFKKSLSRMDKFVKNIIGVTPRYFRAPGGNCGVSCVNLLENMGYRIIKWDVDTEDWKSRSFDSSSSIIKKFANQKNKSYLILMHDSMKHSVKETLPWILSSGIFKNYKFVTVADCLGEKSKMYRESSSSTSSSSSSSSDKNDVAKATITVQRTTTVTRVKNVSATNSVEDSSSVTNSAIQAEYIPVEGAVDQAMDPTNVPPISYTSDNISDNIVTDNPNVSLTANTSRSDDNSGCMSQSIPNIFMMITISAILVFSSLL